MKYYTEEQNIKRKEYLEIENPWAWLDDLKLLFINDVQFGLITIYLDGGRKFGKTYETCETSAEMTVALPEKLDVYALRWLKTDSQELLDEMLDAVEILIGEEETKKAFKKQAKTFKINGNRIRILGLHNPSARKKVKLTGIRRAKGKPYAIIMIEEAYEFTVNELLQIQEAIGGYDNYCFIYITNPNSLAIPFIEAREKEFPHNEQELKTKGYQFKIEYNPSVIKIWFYGNWRINSHLSVADINTILQAWDIDPARARVIDYGMPGIETDNIYSHEYPKIKLLPYKELIKFKTKSIRAGIDWGDGAGANGSATALSIVGQGYKNETYVYSSWTHYNKDGYKAPTERVKIIVDILEEMLKLKPELAYFGLKVKLDTGLNAEKEMLETETALRGLSNSLFFVWAKKFQERTRINVRKYKINTGRYYVAKENTEHLRELQLQKWDENKQDKQGLPKQEDKLNHTTDTVDYAEDEFQYAILQEDQYLILHKQKKGF